MITNKRLSTSLLAVLALSSSTVACAQSADSAATPAAPAAPDAATQIAPAMPTTPDAASTVATPAAPAAPTMEMHNAVIAPATGDSAMPAPAPVVTEMPKADGSIMEAMTNAWNSKNADEIVGMMSKDGFVKVDMMGAAYKDTDSLRKMITEKFAGEAYTYTSNVDMVKDVAPGVAVISGTMMAHKSSDAAAAPMKVTFTATVKYEDGAWKFVSSQGTSVKDAHAEEAKPAAANGGMGKTLALMVIGVALGFFGGRFTSKKAA